MTGGDLNEKTEVSNGMMEQFEITSIVVDTVAAFVVPF